MPRTMTRPPSARSNRQALPLVLLAGVLCAGLILPLAAELQDLPRAGLTITNDTQWDVGVQLVTDDGSLRHVATLRRGTTRTIPEVLVPGDTWQFRWTVEGSEAHRSSIGHDELRGRDFKVAVPEQVADAAEAAALPVPR